MQGGKLAAQYDKESKGQRNMAFKEVSSALNPPAQLLTRLLSSSPACLLPCMALLLLCCSALPLVQALMECEVGAGVGEAQEMRILTRPSWDVQQTSSALIVRAETYAVVCAWMRAASLQDITSALGVEASTLYILACTMLLLRSV